MAKYINADQFLADESEAFMKAQIQLARSSKDITYKINEVVHQKIQRLIADAPDEAVTEVVFCKDCVKHNIALYDLKDKNDGSMYGKDEACPLVRHRGKAQGHEFDYQYCSCGRRKT